MQALTTTIKVRDQDGRVIDEKEVATYAGLLARAHEEGLKGIITELVQVPSKDNGQVAIAKAQVTTGKGVFNGIGDASPGNVNKKIAPHIIRMAETRAKARALRDAVNIGIVCLEELGGEEGDASFTLDERREGDQDRPGRDRDRGERGNVRDLRNDDRRSGDRGRPDDRRNRGPEPMSDAQRRLMYRIMADEGYEGESATDEILRRANVRELSNITKRDASQLIDEWKRRAA